MKTEKWYWAEPFLFQGQANMLERTAWKDRPAMIIDRSLFYPEGGGQKGDRGELVIGTDAFAVLDAQIDDEGKIYLLLDRAPSESCVGLVVICRVNEHWRRRQMSQHTGQHMLSRVLHEHYRAPTVSARLGDTNFSLEIDSSTITWEELQAAETELNELILKDLPIRAWFPTAEELAGLDLRKQPSVTEGIRVIQVEGFDVTPCGGTHCTRTGQVGMVHIQSMERYKGMTRLWVSVGLDAAREFQKKDQTLQLVRAAFDANDETVVGLVKTLQANYRALEQEKEAYMQRAAQAEVERCASQDSSSVHLITLDVTTPDYARLVSKYAAEKTSTVVIVTCSVGEEMFIVADRAKDSVIDVGTALKQTFVRHSGKGGGSATHAEGRVSKDKAPLFMDDLRTQFQV